MNCIKTGELTFAAAVINTEASSTRAALAAAAAILKTPGSRAVGQSFSGGNVKGLAASRHGRLWHNSLNFLLFLFEKWWRGVIKLVPTCRLSLAAA